jgi:hypothetical protein
VALPIPPAFPPTTAEIWWLDPPPNVSQWLSNTRPPGLPTTSGTAAPICSALPHSDELFLARHQPSSLTTFQRNDRQASPPPPLPAPGLSETEAEALIRFAKALLAKSASGEEAFMLEKFIEDQELHRYFERCGAASVIRTVKGDKANLTKLRKWSVASLADRIAGAKLQIDVGRTPAPFSLAGFVFFPPPPDLLFRPRVWHLKAPASVCCCCCTLCFQLC